MVERDDRLLPETRWVLWPVVAVLVAAFAILWGFPDRTPELWAWDIDARMTPLFMGSVYGAGAFFFAMALLGGRWVPAAAGTLAASLFAALMLLATLLHWDKFNHGDAPAMAAASFWAWVVIYALSPFVVFWLWWRNRRTDPGMRSSDVLVGRAARTTAGVAALGALAFGCTMLVAPTTFIDSWPWPLTPLTARVMGCFGAQLGIGMALLARDPRWRAWRLLLATMLVASTLVLIGMLRAWDTFVDADARSAMAAMLAATIVIIGAFIAVMSRREAPSGAPTARSAG